MAQEGKREGGKKRKKNPANRAEGGGGATIPCRETILSRYKNKDAVSGCMCVEGRNAGGKYVLYCLLEKEGGFLGQFFKPECSFC